MKTIYLKLTDRCNLHCKHCYNDKGNAQLDMKHDIILKSLDFIKQQAQIDNVLVVFHGGEPMLVSPDIYFDIMSRLEDSRIAFTITTNLSYDIEQQHIDLFKKMVDNKESAISTSWDYKIRFLDSQKKKWEDNVVFLVENGIDVKPIVTVTSLLISDVQPKKLFDYMVSLGVETLNFERLTSTGRAQINNFLMPANAQIDSWLYEAYEEYMKLDNFAIPLFDTLYDSIENQNYIGCRQRKCTSNVVTINVDGSISGCPNSSNIVFGNVVDGISMRDAYCAECKKENIKNPQCYVCELCKYCNGECYQLRFDDTGCPGLKKTMHRMLEEVRSK